MNIEKDKEDYSKIGRIWCPALEDFIAFDDAGFHHLIWKNRKHRTKLDQKRRFRLLPITESILTRTEAIINYEEREIIFPKNRHGEVEIVPQNAAFWAFVSIRGNQIVTVIIRRVGQGDKHFYSVFDKTK